MDWMKDPRFGHFWSNYQNAQGWYLKHQMAYWRAKAIASEYENQYLHWFIHQMVQGEETVACESETSYIDPQLEEPTDIFEMEISEDMLEFLAHSMKHKQQRGEEKVSAEQVTYINIDEVPLEARPPDLSENSNAMIDDKAGEREKYLSLYGANASRIQAMETAIQLNFHRNCDKRQPKLWPNMPLKM